jgi:uncharacterized membrane protein
VAFAGLYLLNPSLHRANLFDVHAFVFAAPFVIAAYALARKGKTRPAFACAAVALICREDLAITVSVLAVLWIVGGPRRLGVVTLALAILWGYLAFGQILPAFNPHGYIYTNRLALADSPLGLISLAVNEPAVISSHLLRPERLAYYGYLLIPFGFLSLAAPHLLLLAAPTLFSVLFSTHGGSRLLLGHYHYHALALPGLLLAAMAGLGVVSRWVREKIRERFFLAAVMTMLVLTVATGVIWRDKAYAWPRFDRARLESVNRAKALIPPGASVAASYALGSHVAGRRDLYTLYSPKRTGADYIFLSTCKSAGCDGMARVRYDAQMDEILSQSPYELIHDEGGIKLLRREGGGREGRAQAGTDPTYNHP